MWNDSQVCFRGALESSFNLQAFCLPALAECETNFLGDLCLRSFVSFCYYMSIHSILIVEAKDLEWHKVSAFPRFHFIENWGRCGRT